MGGACEQLGCRLDYLAAHFYTATPQELMVILQDFSERYGGRKLWLTEFAVAKEHDSNPWFWIDPVNSLLEQEHPRLTEVGKAYNYAHHLHLDQHQGNKTN